LSLKVAEKEQEKAKEAKSEETSFLKADVNTCMMAIVSKNLFLYPASL
jgi:hypothetical protein